MQLEFIATMDWIRTALGAKDKAQYWSRWREELARPSELLDTFSLLPDLSIATHLPTFSFVLRIPFRLQKPYLSKDERDFHLLDNPVRKEKVFQVPMVAATSWKGALRTSLWQRGYKEENEVVSRLIGNPRGTDEHRAGRLYFYPTFFNSIDLVVINPHNRETGIGDRGPILMESVPKETKGALLLVYVPFGPIEQREQERRNDVALDLEVLTGGVQAMLTTYGFGAKTSSGFGTTEDRLPGPGKLVLRANIAEVVAPTFTTSDQQTESSLPRYLSSPGQLRADFCREDGILKTESEYKVFLASQGKQYRKKEKQLYEKARKWWERVSSQQAETASQQLEPETAPAHPVTPPVTVTEWTFSSLAELQTIGVQVANQLRKGGEV